MFALLHEIYKIYNETMLLCDPEERFNTQGRDCTLLKVNPKGCFKWYFKRRINSRHISMVKRKGDLLAR